MFRVVKEYRIKNRKTLKNGNCAYLCDIITRPFLYANKVGSLLARPKLFSWCATRIHGYNREITMHCFNKTYMLWQYISKPNWEDFVKPECGYEALIHIFSHFFSKHVLTTHRTHPPLHTHPVPIHKPRPPLHTYGWGLCNRTDHLLVLVKACSTFFYHTL